MDMMAIINTLLESGSDGFHDAIYEATGVSHSKKDLKELFLLLPFDVQMIGIEWGLNDTEFRDAVFVHITKEMAADKQI